MNIDNLTIGEAREIAALFKGENPDNDAHWQIGGKYLIRTVTMVDTGVLVAVTPKELVLKDAAWIPDTGRFADAIVKAEFCEVEPFPDGELIIGRGAIIDAVTIRNVPRSQK